MNRNKKNSTGVVYQTNMYNVGLATLEVTIL